MTDLPRAQAVVAGCTHTFCTHTFGRIKLGACAPCLVAYAEQVRREERERCAKIAENYVQDTVPQFEAGEYIATLIRQAAR